MAQTVGLPAAVYTDRHAIFVRTDDHWTVAEQLAGVQEPTQVGRAFQALGIEHIVAKTPQAKGRIERLWGTLQDRLVAELRLAGVRFAEQRHLRRNAMPPQPGLHPREAAESPGGWAEAAG
jgi:hypothetical protein